LCNFKVKEVLNDDVTKRNVLFDLTQWCTYDWIDIDKTMKDSKKIAIIFNDCKSDLDDMFDAKGGVVASMGMTVGILVYICVITVFHSGFIVFGSVVTGTVMVHIMFIKEHTVSDFRHC